MTNHEPTDTEFELIDLVSQAITDDLQTASTIARKAKIATTATYRPLAWLVTNKHIVANGNGAWTKYRNRRFGET